MFEIFLIIGILHGGFYAKWGNEIFEFSADPEYEKIYEEKMKNMKTAPRAWKIERFLHRFIGVFIGWLTLWFLLEKRLDLFSSYPTGSSLDLSDFLLLLVGFIGINGRLPSIAHTVEKWFGLRRP